MAYSKVRDYVTKSFPITTWYSFFSSDLNYGCEVWGRSQNIVLVQGLQKLQQKVVCLTGFKTNPNAVGQLFNEINILKLISN